MADLRNDTYIVLLHSKGGTERYYRDKDGWVKVGMRGRLPRQPPAPLRRVVVC
jgi:hypothetical protein